MYAFLFSDVIFISETEVIYLFTLLMKGKNPSKTSQDYCSPGKRKIIEKISPPGKQKALIISTCCTFLFNNSTWLIGCLAKTDQDQHLKLRSQIQKT